MYNGGSLSTFPIAVCCPAQTLTMVKIELQFTRLRPFYIINFIVPALLLALCMLLAFLLPTECGERLGYSLTILLSYTVLLTIVADMMPTTSKQTPHIGKISMCGSRRGTGGPDPSFKNIKNIGFLSNTGPDPLKITRLPILHSMLGHHQPASETPFKWRFLNGVLLAGRWWPTNCGFWILPPSSN